MKMIKHHRVRHDTDFDLLESSFEGFLKTRPASAWGEAFVVIASIDQIRTDSRQKDQFAAHAFVSRTFGQNCSWESPTAGFRSYSAQRLSTSKRCETGAGNASG